MYKDLVLPETFRFSSPVIPQDLPLGSLASVEIPAKGYFYSLDAFDNSFANCVVRSLENCGVDISQRFEYIPPERKYPRTEKVPDITDPSLTYIIIDDVVAKGTTLGWAVKALEGKSVKKENIWFYTGRFFGHAINKAGPYLDKVSVFQEYLKSYSY